MKQFVSHRMGFPEESRIDSLAENGLRKQEKKTGMGFLWCLGPGLGWGSHGIKCKNAWFSFLSAHPDGGRRGGGEVGLKNYQQPNFKNRAKLCHSTNYGFIFKLWPVWWCWLLSISLFLSSLLTQQISHNRGRNCNPPMGPETKCAEGLLGMILFSKTGMRRSQMLCFFTIRIFFVIQSYNWIIDFSIIQEHISMNPKYPKCSERSNLSNLG